jgi:5-methylcytosine-specific restriction endonuclease McrA
MDFQETYSRVRHKRALGIDYQMVHHWHRQEPELWAISRERVWLRDRGRCQSPTDAPPKQNDLCQQTVALEDCHIDHVRPLSSGGSNHARNLRTLCPICQALRLDEKHRGMLMTMVKKGLIPIDWRQHTWE